MTNKHFKLKGILLYNIFFVLAATIFYYLIPVILNYPPNSINNAFERGIDDGMTFNVQFTLIIIVAMILFNSFFLYQVYKVSEYKKYTGKEDEKSKEKLESIKRKCFSSPYKIYAVHALLPSIAIAFVLCVTGAERILSYRIALLVFAFTLVLALLSYISSKEIFTNILSEINNQSKSKKRFDVGYKWKIIFLIYPLIMATVFLFAFATNSMLADERGNFIYENYNSQMDLINFEGLNTIEGYIEKLGQITKHSKEDTLFIISKDAVLYADINRENISDFFIRYTFFNCDANSNECVVGRTYGYYASKFQGAYKFFYLNGEKIAVRSCIWHRKCRKFICCCSNSSNVACNVCFFS